MSEWFWLWVYVVFAVLNFVMQDWKLLTIIFRFLWATLRRAVVKAWHWSATWQWDALFSVGWGWMLGAGEYVLSLCFLCIAVLGAIARTLHWKKDIASKTAVLLIVLSIGGLMALVTLANKGTKPWSPTAVLIDSRLASRVPLPPDPATIHIFPPKGIRIEHTSTTEWAQLEYLLKERRATTTHPAPAIQLEASVIIGVETTSDDNALSTEMTHTLNSSTPRPPYFVCGTRFTCYTPNGAVGGEVITLDLSKHNWARVFVSVINASETTIPAPYVNISVITSSLTNRDGVSMYPVNGRNGTLYRQIEFQQKQTSDILPYSRSKTSEDTGVDIEVRDPAITDFQILFRIFSSNLTLQMRTFNCHVVR